MLGVRPALEHPNVTLVTNAEAVRLDTNPAGTVVTGVVADHDGDRETFTGDLVVVSCGAANSAKLLLASASDAHPDGLANGSGQVGRNYMFHNSQAVLALSKEPNPTVFQKTLGVNDFYFGGPDFDFPMGNIQMIGKSQADMFQGEKPLETKLAPGFALRDVAGHAVDFWLSTEDLPVPENRVTLERDGNVKLSYTASNQTAAEPPVPPAQVDARPPRHAPRPPDPAARLPQDRHPGGRGGPPGRDLPVRDRPGHLGAGRQLPGPRARQPVRRRHQLLPEHRGGEPGPDGHGQRVAGRRPPARADGGTMSGDQRTHVVVVGGGFAGVACAKRLAGEPDVRVTLLDRNGYHQFQPLLYQVATTELTPRDIAFDLEPMFEKHDNVEVRTAEVVAADPEAKTVTLADQSELAADAVVLAAGSQPNFFHTPGAEEFTFPLYSLDDAQRLRSRVLQLFEDASRKPELVSEGALTFVVVGAGATGVEIAGALAELTHDVMPHVYQNLAIAGAKVILVDLGHAVLGPFSDDAHELRGQAARSGAASSSGWASRSRRSPPTT